MVPKSSRENKIRKEAFRKMTLPQKINYIFAYYKLPIFTAIVAAAVLIISVVGYFNKKNPVLYLAFANVGIGDSLREELTDNYLRETGRDPSKNECILYEDLYLAENPSAEDHQYSYASKIKVLGSIEANKMDMMLMNKEAYDQMSRSGLLLDLTPVISSNDELIQTLGSLLVENEVILEDNSIAYDLGKDESYEAITDYFYNAIDITSLPLIKEAGFPSEVYLGIIANTKNLEECLQWVSYLCKATN